MPQNANCARCGKPLDAELPGGLCSACALNLAIEVGDAPATQQTTDPNAAAAPPPVVVPLAEGPGSVIGRYKLLQKIGEGGCGVVYMAEQEEPVHRRVALKVIKLGMDTREVIARFEAERQALALMDHPNIAKVFDAGATETGRPYFVMELVRGIRITEFCDEHHLSTCERLDLFMKVCHAIQHAHQKGIIHRDIKPSNVLVASHDGPATAGCPKVIDFGIAKATGGRLTDKTYFTAFEQFIGTPAYMSPEQAELSGLDIDTRTDIYSLGVLLYELLVGSPPFDPKELSKAGLDEIRRIIREVEPPKPSTRLTADLVAADVRRLRPEGQKSEVRGQPEDRASSRRRLQELIHLLRGDLDWIVMKCLEKDRTRRYETANGLAMDLKRHLSHEPVVARPPSVAYQLQKWVRRNKLAVAAASVVVAALVLVLVVSVFYAMRERSNSLHLQHSLAQQYLRGGQGLCENGETEFGLHWFVRALDEAPPSSAALREVIQENLLSWGRRLNVPIEMLDLGFGFHTIVLTADGTRVAAGAHAHGKVRQWSIKTGLQVGPELPHANPVRFLAVSRDGKLLVTRSDDFVARLWSGETGRLLRELRHPAQFQALAFSPEGTRLAIGCLDGSAQVWSAETGQLLLATSVKHRGGVTVVAFSPDGSRLLTASEDATARLWTSDTGEPTGSVLTHEKRIEGGAFSPDGQWVVTASVDHTARVWSADTGAPVGRPMQHEREVYAAAFSPDGQRVVTGSWDQTARLWSARTGEPLGVPLRHEGLIYGVAFRPDGETVLVSTMSRVVAWSVKSKTPDFVTLGDRRSRAAVTFGPGGKQALTGDPLGSVTSWTVETGEPAGPTLRHGRYGVWTVALSPDHKTLLTTGNDPTVRFWSAETGRPLGLRLAHPTGVRVAAFSPDGRLVATGCYDGRARLWSASTGAHLGPELQHPGFVMDLAFSPDGQRLATACGDGEARVWSVETGQLLLRLPGQRAEASAVAFTPDGRLIATGSHDRTARLWNAATGQPQGAILEHPGWVEDVCFTPDGRRLVTAGADHRVRFWSLDTGEQLSPPLLNDAPVLEVVLSPDGKRLLTGADGPARLWKLAEPLPAERRQFYLRHADLWVEGITMMEMDGSGVIGWLGTDTWRARVQQLKILEISPSR